MPESTDRRDAGKCARLAAGEGKRGKGVPRVNSGSGDGKIFGFLGILAFDASWGIRKIIIHT